MEKSTQLRKVYLAGPMSNVPYFNFPTFHEGAKRLREKGYEVFSPAECDQDRGGDFWKNCPTGSHEELAKTNTPQINYKDCMRIDLNWILDNADAIALLPGWHNSKGAKAEKALADCLNLETIVLSDVG